jgi:hypothetical protein
MRSYRKLKLLADRKLLFAFTLVLLLSSSCFADRNLAADEVANTILTNKGQSNEINITLPAIQEGMQFTLFITDATTAGQFSVQALDPITWIDWNLNTYSVTHFSLMRGDPFSMGSQVDCVAINTSSGLKWFCRNISGGWAFGS